MLFLSAGTNSDVLDFNENSASKYRVTIVLVESGMRGGMLPGFR